MSRGIEAGTVFAGNRVVRALGAGQMGDVYEATSPRGTRVALKVLRTIAGAEDELVARFQREASVSTTVRHPNVVEVYDRGVHDGAPYLVMPLLEGEDLDACLGRVGPLRPDVAVAIARAAGEGLDAAHRAGIVHRDLKPANIFLDRRAGRVHVVVCDFGVAKVLAEIETLTASGAVLGTPLYMALEQFVDSKRVDARCDVWALGMTLYHALAGAPAFAGVSGLGDLLVALREERIPPLQARAPWVPPGLARVVHAALLPRDRRFPSMRAFLDALARWAPCASDVTPDDLVAPPETARMTATEAELPHDARELAASDDATIPVSPTAASVPPDPMIGRRFADRYELVGRLGAGGMGAVFEAVDTRAPEDAPHRTVAVKVMLVAGAVASTDAIRRFLREARAAQRVSGEHVAKVLDTGVDAASRAPFIVMERLRGRDLGAILSETSALEPEVAVSLFLQACEGLAAAHALGLVHRDVKPSNLFVHEDGARIVLKVCDFGVAKQLAVAGEADASADLTQTGGLLGSPMYMSPEQARSAKNVDERSDVFSLGLSLHEALSGMRPWQGRASMGEIILAVCTEDVPPLATVAPWIDPALSAVVARALVRDREGRWSSIRDFAEALRPFALSRALARGDLAAVSNARRAATHPIDARVATADPMSVSHDRAPARGGRRWAALGSALALFAAAGAVASWRLVRAPEPASTQARPEDPAPPAPQASVPSALPAPLPSAAPVASASAAPSAVASLAGRPAAPAPRPRPQASATAPATRDAPASPAVPPASATVGRGMTATDLP